MGATTFMTRAKGKTPREAFYDARKHALHMHGHGGYTGTIAEKYSFTVINAPPGSDPKAFAQGLLDEADPRIDDKRDPAGCVKVAEGEYLFFGWAAS